jgi:hypothetical protein
MFRGVRKRVAGELQPGWPWGPFTLRVPLWHTGISLPELLQGLVVSAATGLALVPYLTGAFGLSFEAAVWMSMLSAILISSGPIIFGEPFAPGWITPALPLSLGFVLAADAYPTPTEKFQIMTALSIDLALILLLLGLTGLGRWLVERIPAALKGALIMGASIAAFRRVLEGDNVISLERMFYTLLTAMAVCLVLAFSLPVGRLKQRWGWLSKLASLGLLPGFLLAGVVGVLVGELSYVDASGASLIRGGLLIPPVQELWQATSPLVIGWPSATMFFNALPLALIAYVILFGDLVTGMEVLRGAVGQRPDERIEFSGTRTHLSTGIRNLLMSIFAPFFPSQGSLWTGVHVVIVKRWAEGPSAMDSLYTGISSYYFFGLPLFYLLLPFCTALGPMLPVALVLTLVMTGFACAYVAMEIPRSPVERGVVLLGGACIAFLSPLAGLTSAILASFLLLGFRDTPHQPSKG